MQREKCEREEWNGSETEPKAIECKFASMSVCATDATPTPTTIAVYVCVLFDSCSRLREKGELEANGSDSWSGLRDNRIRQMQERFHMRFFTVASNYDKRLQF